MLCFQTAIEAKYRDLQDCAASRRHQLSDNKKLFEFFREVDEVSVWIKEQAAVAGSEDYGTDLEHVQVGGSTDWEGGSCGGRWKHWLGAHAEVHGNTTWGLM